jgi:hypothetical protein
MKLKILFFLTLVSVSLNGAVMITDLEDPFPMLRAYFDPDYQEKKFYPFDIDGDGDQDIIFRSTLTILSTDYNTNFFQPLALWYPNDFNDGVMPVEAGESIGSHLDNPNGWIYFSEKPSSTLTAAGAFEPPWIRQPFADTFAYIGFRLKIDENWHYGWMLFEGYSVYPYGGVLHAWAWETEPNTAILTPPIDQNRRTDPFRLPGGLPIKDRPPIIPEPATLLLIALGLTTLALRQRKS